MEPDLLVNLRGITPIRVLTGEAVRLFDEVPDGAAVIGGTAIVFDEPGGANDLDGLFFTRSTYLGASDGNGADLTWNHMQPILPDDGEDRLEDFARSLADHVFRYPVRTRREDARLYFEAMLDLADDYEAFVRDVAATGRLGASTGAPQHMVRLRSAGGEAVTFTDAIRSGYGEMDRWPVAEIGATVIPAEPRTRGVLPVRSLPAIYERPALRQVSLSAQVNDVFRAFHAAFDPRGDRPVWIEEVFDDAVVASLDGTLYRIGYERDGSEVTFAERNTWQEVERRVEWVARAASHRSAYLAAVGKTDPEPESTEPESSPVTPPPTKPEPIMYQHLRNLIAAFEAAQDDEARASLRTALLAALGAEALPDDAPDDLAPLVEAVRTWAPAPDDGVEALRRAVEAQSATIAAMQERMAETQRGENRGTFAAPNVNTQTPRTRRYDGIDTIDLAICLETLRAAERRGNGERATPSAYLALAERMTSEEAQQNRNLRMASQAFRRFSARHGWRSLADVEPGEVAARSYAAQREWNDGSAFRANELMGSTVTNGGDEWIGVGYSNQLWDDIYNETVVLARLNPQEWPWPGAESGTSPIVDKSVKFYKVAQTTDLSASPGGIPSGKTTESKLDTGNVSHTLAKLGGRVIYTGEMTEDSMLPFAAALREDMVRSATEHLESAIIDGDTDATASTNINDIAGTPAATDYFLSFNGFRKLGLVTATGQSFDVAGALTAATFVTARSKLGTGGNRGLDPRAFFYLIDTNTFYKAIDLPEVKTTAEIGPNATIITGRLPVIYGTDIVASAHMHLVGDFTQSKKTNTAGKVDQDTAGNNTKGALLAVVPNMWRFYWRRRMTIETMRWPYADANDIVLHLRASLNRRDTSAASIGYNITV